MIPLLVFETHPIQYRCPVYQELQRIRPGTFKVIFASDFSVRGYADQDFGKEISWDTPLLSGYDYEVLGNDREGGINRWSGLSGDGVAEVFRREKPAAVMFSSFGYRFSCSVFCNAKRHGVPVWIRMETQDDAIERSRSKAVARSFTYRNLYRTIDRFFTIGNANKEHYIRHGVPAGRLRVANYCTPDPVAGLSLSDKSTARSAMRDQWNVTESDRIVGFFGKLISKKNPSLLIDAWKQLGPETRSRVKLLFVGSGELESQLRAQAEEHSIPVIFAGFVNQSELSRHYLATDILVLPSRKMGETWGLVVNEGLHAGCSVITSNHVGCRHDFQKMDRFCVIEDGDAQGLARSIEQLVDLPREFDWAQDTMDRYSIRAAAQSIGDEIDTLT